MNKKVKEKWLDRLRNGGLKQATSALKETYDDGTSGYCCLGVLCEIAVEEGIIKAPRPEWGRNEDPDSHYGNWTYGRNSDSFLPPTVRDWAGLSENNPAVNVNDDFISTTLATLNDSGSSFEEIAGYIEASL